MSNSEEANVGPAEETTNICIASIARLCISGYAAYQDASEDGVYNSLLAVSNKFGYVVFGTDDGFAFMETKTVHSLLPKNQNKKEQVTLGDLKATRVAFHDSDSAVNQIRLSADQKIVVVALTSGHIHLFDAAELAQGISTSFKKFMSPNEEDVAILPNPESYPNLCAVNGADLSLHILDMDTGVFTPIDKFKTVYAMCWSRKGKQLAIADESAVIRQISIDGTPKNLIKPPPSITATEVKSIFWLEDKTFIVLYSVNQDDENQEDETAAYIITQSGTAKTGIKTKYMKIENPCPILTNRTNLFYPNLISSMGSFSYLLPYANFSSSSIGLLGFKDGSWNKWLLPSDKTIDIPGTGDEDDSNDVSFPIGVDIDFTSTDVAENGLPPAPLIYVRTSAGYLVVFSVIDETSKNRNQSCSSMVDKIEVIDGGDGPTRLKDELLAAQNTIFGSSSFSGEHSGRPFAKGSEQFVHKNRVETLPPKTKSPARPVVPGATFVRDRKDKSPQRSAVKVPEPTPSAPLTTAPSVTTIATAIAAASTPITPVVVTSTSILEKKVPERPKTPTPIESSKETLKTTENIVNKDEENPQRTSLEVEFGATALIKAELQVDTTEALKKPEEKSGFESSAKLPEILLRVKQPKAAAPSTFEEVDNIDDFSAEFLEIRQIPVNTSIPITQPFKHPENKAIFYNLLAISNKFGYVVYGTQSGFGFALTEDIRTAITKAAPKQEVKVLKAHEVPLEYDLVNQIRLSAAQDLVLIGLSSGSILVFKVSDLVLSPLDCASVILPNPEAFPNICALNFSNGLLYMFNVETDFFDKIEISGETSITAICWSRKGKQLAIGDDAGVIRQITLDGVIKNTIKPPESLGDGFEVSNMFWLEDKTFVVIFSREDRESRAFIVIQSGTAKTGIHTAYTEVSDPCIKDSDTERKTAYISALISDMGDAKYILSYGNYSGDSIGFLGCKDGIWNKWVPKNDDIYLPVTENDDNTYTVGLDIDFHSKDKIKSQHPDLPDLCPAPLVYVLNNVGSLLVYAVVDDTSSERNVSCASMCEAEKLPGTVKVSLKAEPLKVQTQPEIVKSDTQLFKFAPNADEESPAISASPKIPQPAKAPVFGQVSVPSFAPKPMAPLETQKSLFGNGSGFLFVPAKKEISSSMPVKSEGPIFGSGFAKTTEISFTNPVGSGTPPPPLFGPVKPSPAPVKHSLVFENPAVAKSTFPFTQGTNAKTSGTSLASDTPATALFGSVSFPSSPVPSTKTIIFSNEAKNPLKSGIFGVSYAPASATLSKMPLFSTETKFAPPKPLFPSSSAVPDMPSPRIPVESKLIEAVATEAPIFPVQQNFATKPPFDKPAPLKPIPKVDKDPSSKILESVLPVPTVPVPVPAKKEPKKKTYDDPNSLLQLFDRLCAEFEDDLIELQENMSDCSAFVEKAVKNSAIVLQQTHIQLSNANEQMIYVESDSKKICVTRDELVNTLRLVAGKQEYAGKLFKYLKEESKDWLENTGELGPEFAYLQTELRRKIMHMESSLSDVKASLVEIKEMLEIKRGVRNPVKLPDWDTICRNIRRITNHTLTISKRLDGLLQNVRVEKRVLFLQSKNSKTTPFKNSFAAVFDNLSDDENFRPTQFLGMPESVKKHSKFLASLKAVTSNSEFKPRKICAVKAIGAISSSESSLDSSLTTSLSGWTCSICLLLNTNAAAVCVACENKRIDNVANSQSTSLGWICAVCLVPNIASALMCVACESKKSGETVTKPSLFNTNESISSFSFNPTTASSGGFSFAPVKATNSEKWECTTCLVSNEVSVDVCVACETTRGGSKVVPKPSLFDSIKPKEATTVIGGFSFTQSEPKQDVSMKSSTFQDKSSGGLSFATGKSTESTGFSFQPAASGGFSFPFNKPSLNLKSKSTNETENSGEQWTCDSCLVSNVSAASQCIACEAKRNGKTKLSLFDTSSSSGPGFTAPQPILGSFSFGTAANLSDITQAQTAAFSFKPNAEEKFASAVLAGPRWTCSTCLITNDNAAIKCEACETKRPSDYISSESSSFVKTETAVSNENIGNEKKPEFGFGGSKSAVTTEGWTCNICLVTNQEFGTKCVSCGNDRDGKPTPKTSLFGSTSSAPVTSESTSTGFALSAKPDAESSEPALPLFGTSIGPSSFISFSSSPAPGFKPSVTGEGPVITSTPISFVQKSQEDTKSATSNYTFAAFGQAMNLGSATPTNKINPMFGSAAQNTGSVFGSGPVPPASGFSFLTPASSQSTPAGGGASVFGNVSPPSNSAPFGSGSVFGGAKSNGSPAFGTASATGSAFGQTSNPVTNSSFGQPGVSAFGQTSGSVFGSQTANTSSAFGKPAITPAAVTGSVFGQPAAPSTFGQTSSASAFGQPPAAVSAFGQKPSPSVFSQTTSTSAFGQAPAQSALGQSSFGQQTASTASPFGQKSAFGQAAATGSAFGQSTFGQAGTPVPAFGQSAFGTAAPAFPSVSLGQTKSVFGQSSSAATGGFGGFAA
ncbi:hypothetical protein HK100_007553 [Physocladia obscura]|uniref:Nuclear pore complex protein Nup153 n=1 Tax=Physocladia obscura TaxID=109957 RepID=A0AAD5T590_9FUNG|nr:hypothetical protein HK100_007553 [Physocladia obscura]